MGCMKDARMIAHLIISGCTNDGLPENYSAIVFDQACTKREKIPLISRIQKLVEMNAYCGSICKDQEALFLPHRMDHEDWDSEGYSTKKRAE